MALLKGGSEHRWSQTDRKKKRKPTPQACLVVVALRYSDQLWYALHTASDHLELTPRK